MLKSMMLIADDYLEKPCSEEMLVRSVKNLPG